MRHTFALLLVVACIDQVTPTGVDPSSNPPSGEWGSGADPNVDRDGDGVPADQDCDDFDPAVNPAATEVCANGEDDDCDGEADCDAAACEHDSSCSTNGPSCGRELGCDDDACRYTHECSPCPIQITAGCHHNWNPWYVTPVAALADYAGELRPGPEVIYEFLSPLRTTVTVTIDPEDSTLGFGGNDVAVYLMDGVCHPDLTSMTAATSALGDPESLTFVAEPWTWYYFSVEDVGGSSAEFDIAVDCSP